MQVISIAECSKGSILQYFWPSLSYHLSLRSLFCLFWVAVLHRFYCRSTSLIWASTTTPTLSYKALDCIQYQYNLCKFEKCQEKKTPLTWNRVLKANILVSWQTLTLVRESSGSVEECLTQDRGLAGSSLFLSRVEKQCGSWSDGLIEASWSGSTLLLHKKLCCTLLKLMF